MLTSGQQQQKKQVLSENCKNIKEEVHHSTSALHLRKQYEQDRKLRKELKNIARKNIVKVLPFITDPASIRLSEQGIERLSLVNDPNNSLVEKEYEDQEDQLNDQIYPETAIDEIDEEEDELGEEADQNEFESDSDSDQKTYKGYVSYQKFKGVGNFDNDFLLSDKVTQLDRLKDYGVPSNFDRFGEEDYFSNLPMLKGKVCREETSTKEQLLKDIDNLLKNSEIDFNKQWPIKQVIWNLSCPEPYHQEKIPSVFQNDADSLLQSFYPPIIQQVHKPIDSKPQIDQYNVFSIMDKIADQERGVKQRIPTRQQKRQKK